ncbi:MAG: hypothetical protein HFH60_11610 [Lachnospiraceae bacterium]|nr:hypothetical protein [Lachnospiraceae bacterium]
MVKMTENVDDEPIRLTLASLTTQSGGIAFQRYRHHNRILRYGSLAK